MFKWTKWHMSADLTKAKENKEETYVLSGTLWESFWCVSLLFWQCNSIDFPFSITKSLVISF